MESSGKQVLNKDQFHIMARTAQKKQKETNQIFDRWKSVLWSDDSKFEIFDSNLRVFQRRRVGERRISACVVPTVKH